MLKQEVVYIYKGNKKSFGFYPQGSPGWAEHITFEFLYKEPRKIMLLGAGFSSCSTVVAALAGLEPWTIPQVKFEKYRIKNVKNITKKSVWLEFEAFGSLYIGNKIQPSARGGGGYSLIWAI